MNKTEIKNFAVWARRKLITEITYKAGLLGISEKGIAEPMPQSTKDLQFFDVGTTNYTTVSGKEIKQRNALVSKIEEKEKSSDFKTAFQFVVEEVAYTWFNRLIAIRFMEVNDYLPSRIRVLSSENAAKNEPDFVTTPFETDLEFSAYERDRVMQLKDDGSAKASDELFRMLFIKQCNKLNEILPELFEKTDDFTELLLTISFTDKDGVVYHLVHDINEDDFNVAKEGQIEIIGWMYQYYNSEPKDEVFALLKKNVKITKERIPAATQLFTPDWIVRYMVENSLGRIFVEWSLKSGEWSEKERIAKEKEIADKMGWKYYLPEAEQTPEVRKQLNSKLLTLKTDFNVENIKIIDPCMGSGHILVYAFDVLMQIYESYGYTQQDAAKCIVEKNIYGLDIDDRAYQLAYFAVMMKARQYSRRILNGKNRLNLYSIQDSNFITNELIEFIADVNAKLKADLQSIRNDLHNAKEYGSILNIAPVGFVALYARFDEIKNTFYDDIFGQINKDVVFNKVLSLVKQAETMVQKYDVVVTNPPYMGSSGMSGKLSDFVKAQYTTTKSDLFAAFIIKGNSMAKTNGYNCMVTMQSWMFLSSFEKMREDIVSSKIIANLMHMENMVMGIAFGTAVANFRNACIEGFKGTYNQIKMCDIKDDEPKEFPVQGNRFSQISTENFSKIPGMPIAYWASEKVIKAFDIGLLFGEYGQASEGIKTGNNDLFLKLWFEISYNKFSCMKSSHSFKWYPHHKGGNYRKWYGNLEWVVNWENNGAQIKESSNSGIQGVNMYFKPVLCWSKITSRGTSLRYIPEYCLFDSGSPAFRTEKDMLYCLGFLNSCICNYVLAATNPTLNCQVGNIKSLPLLICESKKRLINELVEKCISISKTDWDYFETSWDFERHPLIQCSEFSDKSLDNESSTLNSQHLTLTSNSSNLIKTAYDSWEKFCDDNFAQLKANEEELNRIFIEIYGLQDELTPEVEDKDVTIRKADLGRDIRSFVSYAVGCMFGRYSVDADGLAYAGGNFDEKFRKYKGHAPYEFDEDGRILGGGYAGINSASIHYPEIKVDGEWRPVTYEPDADNCIPITDEEYFEDDIVGRFVNFVKTVYGSETLEENLDFIANALGNKGNTSREVIRNYFLNDFYKDHCKIYKKRPIYWLFDSGKDNGFKALIYMHRYNADTIGNMRIEYLHRMQKIYESEISRMQETIDNSSNASEITKSQKRKDKLIKQLRETKDYDTKIAHLALARIDLDLDDGVKVNYEKVQTGTDGKRLEVLAKI